MPSEKLPLNRFQKYAIAICCIFIIALIIHCLNITFSFSIPHSLYLTGLALFSGLVMISFMWGLVNSIFIWQEKYSLSKRLVWMVISLLPLFYFGLVLIFSIIRILNTKGFRI